jgi:hypothetical protein
VTEASVPASQPDAAEPPKPELDEYLTSGRRFARWNLVTLVLGLVALTIGLLVVREQHAAGPASQELEDRQGVEDATPR